MTWIMVIGLAALAFAAMVFLFRIPKALWTSVLAVLVLGLAGYAAQGQPNMPGAPTAARADEKGDGWALVEARKRILGVEDQQGAQGLILADAMMRKGQYANAADALHSFLRDNPDSVEGWTALGNALVEHAEGTLSPAALYAFNKAEEADPDTLAPGFFIGATYIRQGELIEGREIWARTLDLAPADAPWRDQLQARLDELDMLMRRIAAMAEEQSAAAQPETSPETSFVPQGDEQ